MRFLRACAARDPRNRVVARCYRGLDGADRLIHLPQTSWDHVDWLEAHGEIAFDAWVRHCEVHSCDGFTLSNLLMYWLWLDLCRRHRYGLPTPTETPPEGFETWREAANDA